MKIVVHVCLLLAVVLSNKILLLSSFADVNIISQNNLTAEPQGGSIRIDSLNQNLQASGAKWVFPVKDQPSTTYPPKYRVIYQSSFQSDCQIKPAKLNIISLSKFTITLNDHQIVSSNGSKGILKFDLSLSCGLNNLTIQVESKGSQNCGVLFSVEQDQSGCGCSDLAATFFNFETCQCQNKTYDMCSSPFYWTGYPSFKCACALQKCPDSHIKDYESCQCDCPNKDCPLGSIQDPFSCECVHGGCQNKFSCVMGLIWNETQCKCVQKPHCVNIQLCSTLAVYDSNLCKCVTADLSINGEKDSIKTNCTQIKCRFLSLWSKESCSCEPRLPARLSSSP